MESETETRAELLSVLHELSEALPGMRFGQLVVNLSYMAREPSHESTWEAEDDELLAAARELLANQHKDSRQNTIPI